MSYKSHLGKPKNSCGSLENSNEISVMLSPVYIVKHCCSEWIMIESGTTSYTAAKGDRIQSKLKFEVSTTLADGSIVHSTQRDVCKMNFMALYSPQTATLSEALLFYDTLLSLLPVPTLLAVTLGSYFCRALAFCMTEETIYRSQVTSIETKVAHN